MLRILRDLHSIIGIVLFKISSPNDTLFVVFGKSVNQIDVELCWTKKMRAMMRAG